MVLFWLPVLSPIILLEGTLWWAGETWSVGRVLDHQQRHPEAVFMRKYFDQEFGRYKWHAWSGRHPEIVALGSSRVMRFRSEMFDWDSHSPDTGFYNAGGLVQTLGDLDATGRALPGWSGHVVVLLGVDMWWFNPGYSEAQQQFPEHGRESCYSWQAHVATWRRMLKTPVEAGTDLVSLVGSDGAGAAIGFGALGKGYGFAFDGSRQGRGDAHAEPLEGWRYTDRNDPPVLDRIRTGTMRFNRSGGLDPQRLDRFRRILVDLTSHGVVVVGFLPPFSSEVVRVLEQSEGHRELWTGFRSAIPELFRSLDLLLVDASIPAAIGCDDRHLNDGFHAMETFHLHVIREWLRDPRAPAPLRRATRVVAHSLGSAATNPWYPDYLPRDRSPQGADGGNE